MLEQFLSTLTPMQAAKARNALEMQVCVNGGTFMRRFEIIEHRVSNGATLAETRHSGQVLMSRDGAFFDKRNITQTGLTYAAFLIETH